MTRNSGRSSRLLARQGGYNLVEVLIATAIIGVVALTVMTLFFLARGNVYSGKQMTIAVAAGNHATEDISSLTMQGLYNAFKVNTASSPSVANYTIDGVTYSNALIRSTRSTVVGSPPSDIALESPVPPATTGGLLTSWRGLVTNLSEGSVTMILMPRAPATPVLNAAGRARASIVQVRIIVRWREGSRRRSAVFDTVKTQRGATP